MYLCRQKLLSSQILDYYEYFNSQINRDKLRIFLTDAKKIGICVGSRGIHLIPEIVKITVRILLNWGKEVIIIPAMGSHGGATCVGQQDVLESLGITEAYCGAPVCLYSGASACGGNVASGRLWRGAGRHHGFTASGDLRL